MDKKELMRRIADPGQFVGAKGDRSLTEWQADAVLAGAWLPKPVGEIVLFGGDLKEVSWAKGRMPPPGTKLYAAPPPST